MKKFTKLACFGLSAVLVLSVAGCSQSSNGSKTTSSQSSTTSQSSNKSKENIKAFLYSTDDTRTSINNYIQSHIAAALPKYNVSFEIGGSDYSQKLKVYNSAGLIPDIIYANGPTDLDPIIEAGNALDLEPYVKAAKFDDKYTDKQAIQPLSDGKLYALNCGADYMYNAGIYYHKDILSKYHITVPTTWDQFLAMCKTLKQNGVTPLTTYGLNGWDVQNFLFEQMILMEKPDVVDQLIDKKTDFSNPVCVDAFNRIATLVKNGYFPTGLVGMDMGTEEALFENNKAAILWDMSWHISDIDKGTDIAIMNLPSASPDVDTSKIAQVWGGPDSGYVASAKSKDLQAAADVAMYMTLAEATHYNADLKVPTTLDTGVKITGMSQLQQDNINKLNSSATKYRTIGNYLFGSNLSNEFGLDSSKLMTGNYTGEDFSKDIGSYLKDNNSSSN